MASKTASRSRSSSPIELPSDTLAILQGFLQEQQEASDAFNAKFNEPSGGPKAVSVAEFRQHFQEDWQNSQFWYSEAFTTRFSKALHALCTPESTVVFLSCPTAYVGFQYEKQLPNARLLEYDTRFRLFAADQFVHYDLHNPKEGLPDEILGKTDLCVIDPPFLNAVTNEHVAETLRLLFHHKSKLVILTSTSVRDQVETIYSTPPLGPVKETQVQVEHAGGISNEFGCWNNWDAKWQI